MHLQAAEIEKRIELETKAEKHIQKLLLLGTFYLGCVFFYLCCIYLVDAFSKLKLNNFSNFYKFLKSRIIQVVMVFIV